MSDVLYETVPVGLWRIDLTTKKLLHANKTTLEILGYSNLDEINSCVDCKKIFSSVDDCDQDFMIKNNQGKNIWVELRGHVNPSGFIEGTIVDITSKKTIESSIKQNIEKISLIKRNIIKRLQDEHLSTIAGIL